MRTWWRQRKQYSRPLVPYLIPSSSTKSLHSIRLEICLSRFWVKSNQRRRWLTVFLSSSEHAYPSTLKDTGLNLADITSKIFVGEIPPNKMWQLLTSATYEKEVTLADGTVMKEGEKIIGMGPNLATLFMSAYGGHFWRMITAMGSVVLQKDSFHLEGELNKLSTEVQYCLKYGTHGGKYGMYILLENMARQGYAMLDYRANSNAIMISQNDTGGVVEKGNTIVGFPQDVWDTTNSEYALVPTSESARFVILKELLIWKAEREEEERLKGGWRRILFWRRKNVK